MAKKRFGPGRAVTKVRQIDVLMGEGENLRQEVREVGTACQSAAPAISDLIGGQAQFGRGLPGYELISMIAMFALVRAPDAIVSCVSQENARVLNKPDGKERLFNTDLEAVGSTPEQRAATVTSEMARIGKLIKDAGLRDE